ncbi:hypothetical protein L1987_29402 [Smallanthus sonchifolius]|uniref:Uncharacterized protein n=1 Tax=Smallanthus sonchifolius TaxID=185202 RepID=A0ACB9I0Q3_9ASTR|nr:hypothetical protein L1987_29402 [Smallanthus sonchifolius]
MVSVSRGMSPKIGRRRSSGGLPGGGTVENEEESNFKVGGGSTRIRNRKKSRDEPTSKDSSPISPNNSSGSRLKKRPRLVNIDLEAPLIAQPFSFPLPNSLDLNSYPSPPACHNAIEDEVNCQMQVLGDTCPIEAIQSSTIRQLKIDGVQIRDNSESSNGLSEEIGDTIKVGGTMGVNLEDFENQLIEEINDEGAHVGYQ